MYGDLFVSRKLFGQYPDRLRLVVLHCYDSLCARKDLQRDAQTLYHLVGLFHKPAVVRGQIGLALGCVHDDRVNLFRFLRRELDVRREACAAHAYDSRLLDGIQNITLVHFSHGCIVFFVFHGLKRSVVFDHDGVYLISCRCKSRLNRLDLSGYGRMNISRNKTACLGDQLPAKNLVSFFYHGLRRRTDVLRKRIDHITLRHIVHDGFILRELFALVRMYSPLKCMLH